MRIYLFSIAFGIFLLNFSNFLSREDFPLRRQYYSAKVVAWFIWIIPVLNSFLSLFIAIAIVYDWCSCKSEFKLVNPFGKQSPFKCRNEMVKATLEDYIERYPNWVELLTSNKEASDHATWLRLGRRLNFLLNAQKHSPYYSGSLLGSVEQMAKLWISSKYTFEFSRYQDGKLKGVMARMPIPFSCADLEFLKEVVEAAEIPHEEIVKLEKKAEWAEQDLADERTREMTKVVGIMKKDLQEFYSLDLK